VKSKDDSRAKNIRPFQAVLSDYSGFRKPDEAKINAFEMKCLRQVLRVSWTANKATGNSRSGIPGNRATQNSRREFPGISEILAGIKGNL